MADNVEFDDGIRRIRVEEDMNSRSTMLAKALLKERNENSYAISAISDDFYAKVLEYIATLNSRQQVKEMANLVELHRMRRSKLMHLADAGPDIDNDPMANKMSREEKAYYRIINKASKKLASEVGL